MGWLFLFILKIYKEKTPEAHGGLEVSSKTNITIGER